MPSSQVPAGLTVSLGRPVRFEETTNQIKKADQSAVTRSRCLYGVRMTTFQVQQVAPFGQGVGYKICSHLSSAKRTAQEQVAPRGRAATKHVGTSGARPWAERAPSPELWSVGDRPAAHSLRVTGRAARRPKA